MGGVGFCWKGSGGGKEGEGEGREGERRTDFAFQFDLLFVLAWRGR